MIQLRQLAHNMKTTVSIMGLTGKLQPHLDKLEYEPLNTEIFNSTFKSISSVCLAAVKEAGFLLDTK